MRLIKVVFPKRKKWHDKGEGKNYLHQDVSFGTETTLKTRKTLGTGAGLYGKKTRAEITRELGTFPTVF